MAAPANLTVPANLNFVFSGALPPPEGVLLNADGAEVDVEIMKNKVIALYFGSFWSSPCIDFTKQLCKTYMELLERLAPVEIIYVPCDKTDAEYKSSLSLLHKNWLCLPHNAKMIEQYTNRVGVMAIPKLVIVDESGNLITMNGRKDILEKGASCFRNWAISANLIDWEKDAIKKKSKDAMNVIKSLLTITSSVEKS